MSTQAATINQDNFDSEKKINVNYQIAQKFDRTRLAHLTSLSVWASEAITNSICDTGCCEPFNF